MMLYLLLLPITTALVYADVCSIVTSDSNPEMFNVDVKHCCVPGIPERFPLPRGYVFDYGEVIIKSVLGSGTPMQVTKFNVSLKKVKFAWLVMKDAARNTLYNQSQKTTWGWSRAKWELGDGIVDVVSIELSFQTTAAKVQFRKLFLEVCFPVGWCAWTDWGECSVTCGRGNQSSVRQCVCPNPDSSRLKCPPGPSERTQECNTDCCKKPPEWTKWGQWSDCSATCGLSKRKRKRKCKKSDCPGEVKTCPGRSVEKEECITPCCKEIINWQTRDSVKIMRKSMENKGNAKMSKDKNAKKVLSKSNKSVLLVKNSDVTQYLDVMLSKEYQILKIEVETLLASNVTLTTSPTGLPPGQGASQVSDSDIGARKWNKHDFNFCANCIGPIDKIRLDFGFQNGKIKAKNLEITVSV